jgi:alkaline phosphatase
MMMRLITTLACLAVAAALTAQPQQPRNIILMVGDGLALSQVTASMYWTGGHTSAYRRCTTVGFHKSHAHDDLVTDSAAGATAFSCGVKTNNSAIGMRSDMVPCETILESLCGKGRATGIVVTSSATHATPAAFIAHREIRAHTEGIALDYLSTPIDCFVGGGAEAFSTKGQWGHLRDSLLRKGYFVEDGLSFRRLPLDGSAPFFLFTAPEEPAKASEGRSYLPSAVEKVLPFLQKRSNQGFFLLVEGSQIDWALHANNEAWLRAELRDFDKAMHKALDFAAADGQTLVIITGDHECGGLAMVESHNRKALHAAFNSRQHTAALVPVFAFGPGAKGFQGIYDNTDLYWKMWEALGLQPNR